MNEVCYATAVCKIYEYIMFAIYPKLLWNTNDILRMLIIMFDAKACINVGKKYFLNTISWAMKVYYLISSQFVPLGKVNWLPSMSLYIFIKKNCSSMSSANNIVLYITRFWWSSAPTFVLHARENGSHGMILLI